MTQLVWSKILITCSLGINSSFTPGSTFFNTFSDEYPANDFLGSEEKTWTNEAKVTISSSGLNNLCDHHSNVTHGSDVMKTSLNYWNKEIILLWLQGKN